MTSYKIHQIPTVIWFLYVSLPIFSVGLSAWSCLGAPPSTAICVDSAAKPQLCRAPFLTEKDTLLDDSHWEHSGSVLPYKSLVIGDQTSSDFSGSKRFFLSETSLLAGHNASVASSPVTS